MKINRLRHLVVPCLLAFNSAAAFQSHPATSLEVAIDSILVRYTGTDRPGATIGIIKEGTLVFQKGYGMADLRLQKANNAQVMYNLASGSKQFTAFVVASLIRQGKLFLTDTLGRFLPEFPAYGRGITVANLLYHTSGIRDYMVLMWLTGKSFGEPFTNNSALELILRQSKLNFKPGERCVYSNSNYILLAEIVHRVTGKTLAVYSSTIFKSLGMNSTSFGAVGIDHKAIKAVSYLKSYEAYLPFKNSFTVYGDGGMLTTLGDLAIWDRKFYDHSSPAQDLLTRGALNNDNRLSYGMGILVSTYRNEPIHTHPGAFLGFRSETLRFPEKKISIICLGNSETLNPEAITRAIADLYVFGDHRPAKPVQARIKADQPIPAGQAALFTGAYQVAPNVLIHIRNEDGNLSGQVTGQPREVLHLDSGATFSIGTTLDKAVFSNPLNGKFQQLTVRQKQGNATALRLSVVSSNDYSRYIGTYYSMEQNASYQFYTRDAVLWFKTGGNAEVKAEVLVTTNRVYFDYRNLEQASIEFTTDSLGVVYGFVLNSGRVSSISFLKK